MKSAGNCSMSRTTFCKSPRFTQCPKISSKLKSGVFFSYLQLKKLYEESQQKIKKLEVETQKLKDENFVLKKNISSLYLTAREEIKRKDAQIRNLQDKEVRNRKILAKSQQ